MIWWTVVFKGNEKKYKRMFSINTSILQETQQKVKN